MARVSRKKQGREAPQAGAPCRIWNAALYVRLSVEDNGRDSDSMENQTALLETFIAARPDLRRTALFVDNGYTGTDFLRPEFQKMMEAVQRGSVDCIVVKDLSRLGRNYIETSRFIEKLCPFYGLRLIAVNDSYDTEAATGEGQLSASLANIINDYYAKDISRKVTSALRTKMERGDYIGHYPPHGYQRDPENKNHLVLCPETAPVIRQIFAWRAEGVSYMGIGRRLNDAGVPSPGQYRLEHGIVTNNNRKVRPVLWNRHMVTKILSDPVYLGQMVQRRNSQCLYRGIPYHAAEAGEWIVVENTHAPIVSREIFDKVQRVNAACAERAKANSGKYALPGERNPYGKKFVCGCCGRAMRLQRSLSTGRDRAYFTFQCPAFAEHGERGCAGVNMRKADVDEAVFRFIKAQMAVFIDGEQTLRRLLAAKGTAQKTDGAAEENRLLRQRLEKKRSLLGSLYGDLKEGFLSPEEYGQHRAVVLSDIEALQAQLAEREVRQSETVGPLTGETRWRQMVRRFCPAEALTAEMVDAFVESMVLGADSALEIKLRYGDELAALLETNRRLEREVA